MELDRYLRQLEGDELAYAQAFPLHAVACAYSSSAVADGAEWLARFRALLDGGQDPCERCDRGHTIWECLDPSGYADFDRLGDAAALLVQTGFNPLLHRSGGGNRPLSFLSHIFLGAEAGSAQEAMGLGAIKGLIDCERSQPMRSANGGNFLHTLASETPELMADVLEHFPLQPVPGDGRRALPAHWLAELDGDGMRPLALFWGRTGAIWQLRSERDAGEAEISAMAIWDATEAMLDTHRGLMDETLDGRPLWKAIQAQMGQQPALRSTLPSRLRTWLEQIQLEYETPRVGERKKSGPRL